MGEDGELGSGSFCCENGYRPPRVIGRGWCVSSECGQDIEGPES